MYDFKTVTLGIVSTRRDTFPSPKKAIEINGRIMERIRPFVDSLDGVTAVYAADVVPDGLICELPETDRVIEYFREKEVTKVSVTAIHSAECLLPPVRCCVGV